MILSSSIPIQQLLHFGFQNHRKSTLQRIKIDIDFSINLFTDFFSIWTPFWEALGKRLGFSWGKKISRCCLSIASELSLCVFLALDTSLDPLLGPIHTHLELQNLSKMLPNKKNPCQY